MIDFDGDAVLFDLDGTLVDSSASVGRAWDLAAAELGVPVSEFVPYMHGIPATQVFAVVVPALPPDDARDLADRMNAAQAVDTEGVKPMPGAVEALAALPTSRWAIVTSGDHRLATARIAAAGLPLPTVLVTLDDVRVGKPDPEGYLAAAARLGFAPPRCLVVEDAPAGVSAGEAAGMPVLGVLTTYLHLDATETVPDLSTVDIHADASTVRVTSRT
ncbi:MAG TPA: HAD-IA family hydrolase [Jatrophihabitantaceae bacterium]|jgi:sugar-phosphatase